MGLSRQDRQGLPQLVHSQSHAGFHGAERLSQLLGDLGLGQALEVGELDDLALVGREAGNGAGELFPLLRRVERDVVVGDRGGAGGIDGVERGAMGRFPAAQAVDRAVADPGKEPGRGRSLRGILPARVLPDSRKDDLKHVLRFRTVSENAPGQGKRHPGIAVVQIRQRMGVAPGDAFQQRLIRRLRIAAQNPFLLDRGGLRAPSPGGFTYLKRVAPVNEKPPRISWNTPASLSVISTLS